MCKPVIFSCVSALLLGSACRGDDGMLYDSGYAANMVAGRWQPNTNTNVVQWARGLLAEVEKTRTVHWVHVKGHSGDGGNDRADELVQCINGERRRAHTLG